MSRKFQRRIEDFRCGHCGADIRGDGYTNHCPLCLWSQHVDEHPGDRQADCGGMMAPVGVELVAGSFIITHRCSRCGRVRKNRAGANDDHDQLIAVASTAAQARSVGRDA